MVRFCVLSWLLLVAGAALHAQHATNSPAFDAAASDARKFQLQPGLKLDVWAAEPQLSNSVAFCFDGQGRVFLAESDRWAISVFDITAHTNWLVRDMSFRNVADRAAFLKQQFATNLTLLTKDSEVVRLLEDRTGGGRADHSEIISDGFNSVVDGTAAGVLATEDAIYFANIPSLWRIDRVVSPNPPSPRPSPPRRGGDALPLAAPSPGGEGRGEGGPRSRSANFLRPTQLATGFGVHIGVSGHDLHGLIKGPDGRIYMSFGDRGCVLTNREGVVINLPDTGGVLRCEPDGRNLEVFCYGLRNPQELAFDDFGNLWTVDNDTAGADPCRVLHLVEGGDYGWRTSYQHMEGFGPWVQEELWKGGQDGILPPAGTVSQGPSGLAFYPGTGFGDRLNGKFLHADFPGGVWAFSVKPKGASYEVDAKEKFLWNCWPTDVDFGPDGAAYILDWVSGWGQTPRGRIYRITDAKTLTSNGESDGASSRRVLREQELIAEVKRLLGEGMAKREEKDLLGLLGHADRRVRLEAQWELADRGTNSFNGLLGVVKSSKNQFARIHALWAIEQIARPLAEGQFTSELNSLMPQLSDLDLEVVGQVATVLGNTGLINANLPITALLERGSPRLQLQAMTALAKLHNSSPYRLHRTAGTKLSDWLWEKNERLGEASSRLADRPYQTTAWPYVRSLLANAEETGTTDPYVVYAASRVLAQSGGGNHDYLAEAASGYRSTERLVALLTLRYLGRPSLTNFLSDPDPRLIVAAGRAIHDVPIVEGFPALASFITKIDCPTNLYSRVIDACFRLGTQQHAQMLAGFAAREDVPDWARVLALRALGDWERPPPLDRVNGLWRPLVTGERPPSPRPSPPGRGGNAPQPDDSTGQDPSSPAVTASPSPGGEGLGEGGPPPRSAIPTPNPLLARAAQAQTSRNLGRASELPVLPPDLGRSASYEEGMAVKRNPAPAQRAFLRVAGDLLNPFNLTEAGLPAGTREVLPLQIAVADTAAKLRVKEASSPLFEKFANSNTPPELRRAILPALAALRSAQTPEAVKLALADPDPQLQAAAVPLLGTLDGEDSAGLLAGLVAAELNAGTNTSARSFALPQAALAALGKIPGAPADRAVQTALEALLAGTLPPALQLDVLAAARERASQSPVVSGLVTKYESAQTSTSGDPLARWRFALAGGDAARGRDIFFNNQTVQCLRCHKIGNDGGVVGPGLDGIGARYPREYLLESIVFPNARIGAGFENAVVKLKDGTVLAGTVKRETANTLVLEIHDPETGETQTKTLRKSEVETREPGLSAMPEGLADQLSPFELRDLVEFLAGRK